MAHPLERGLKEGVGSGLVAGVILVTVEGLTAYLMGHSPLMPVRMFASVALGHVALDVTALRDAVVVGGIVHLLLSAIFGLVYGLIATQFSAETEASRVKQGGFGLLFGTTLWLFDIQLIARGLYPWLLGTPTGSLLMHALFFGLPLGLLCERAERRARALTPTPAH